ncbi:repressor LexA [Alkalicella caledoniensis]|uniref:Repressor LexA n=1 Tax=Alkalicella caledoniensis TaxID=2731377 RepID=A0A7G9W8F6_ALKCA|nr:transcriptional repressor LexA [Alkalicella caledoniensis]QNO14968.1 repressor LexA [Alkalicella caledoniensis]
MNKKIGKRIELKRKEKGLTLKELGDKIGVASSTILRYEKGEISTIKLPVIESIAKILEVDPAWLVLKSDNPAPAKITKSDIKQIPVLGSIAAGTPILAEENIEDYFSIDGRIKADFALNIKGDSMINAGINEGDIVFIHQTPTLENGEIGAILVEGEATLKKFYKNEDSIVLQSENNKYPPMVFTGGDIKILGKLSAVLNISK